MESGSSSDVQHEYGGDVGENPVLVVPPETGRAVVVQAGLASAAGNPGQVAMEEESGSGVD